jgi:hypothetical protein
MPGADITSPIGQNFLLFGGRKVEYRRNGKRLTMYERRYIRKRVRNTIIGIVGSVSTTGVIILSIIAFLGRYVGTFTVSLDTANVQLALAKEVEFENPESYLRITTLPPFEEIAYNQLPSDEELDTQDTDYLSGADYNNDGEVIRLRYFKYTFYVKNTGEVAAKYRLSVVVQDETKAPDGTSLMDTLRVMFYDNDAEADPTTHNKEVYAKSRTDAYVDKDGNKITKTPISTRESQVDALNPFEGYATEFESDKVICTYDVDNFQKGDNNRYTIVTWLDGNDIDSDPNGTVPEGAAIKLGVEINAYEN